MLRSICTLALILSACSAARGPDSFGRAATGAVQAGQPPAAADAGPERIAPPGPPLRGPGSLAYSHASTRVTAGGRGAGRYWSYTPANPTPPTAHVLVYLHGYGDRDPTHYDALLTHFARKGYTVVFPYYGGLFSTSAYERNARGAVRDALAELSARGAPRASGRIAYAGHSLGALLALRLAATARASGLTEPDLILLHEPAGVAFVDYPLSATDLAAIPSGTHLLIIQAETSVGHKNSFAHGAFENTPGIPRANKNLLLVRSDAHGEPRLVSDHLGVQAGRNRPLNAIDWWGYFRPSDAALREAFGGEGAPSIFCSEPGPRCDWARDSGVWSDGRPVQPARNAGDLGL